MLDICQDYGHDYRITYGPVKTVISVVGSKSDAQFYSDVQPWRMNKQKVSVKENNDHLGLIVSNVAEEEKNIDLKIRKARGSLFKLLGPSFSSKCLLSPALKTHLFKTFVMPIARSGLSSMTLSSRHLDPLSLFQRKVLRGFLGLSDSAPIPAVHFLSGELPLHAMIHKDVFSLFYNVWSNPQTKIHEIIRYLLENSPKNSNTWARYIRNLAEIYGIEDPLILIKRSPPLKKEFSDIVNTKVTAYCENELRSLAAKNSKMKWFNVGVKGLNSKPHPLLSGITMTKEVLKSRAHMKLLCDDLFTYEKKAKYEGGSAHCRLCSSENEIEDTEHIINSCSLYTEIRNRVKFEMKTLCNEILPSSYVEEIFCDSSSFTQFVLDFTSLNLPVRIDTSSEVFSMLLNLSRDLCFGIMKIRSQKLRSLKKPCM